MEALLRQHRVLAISTPIERARRVAPPSLALPPQGGGDGERRDEKHEVLQDHFAPPIRNSVASMPSGAWLAAMMMPPPARWSRMTPANSSCPAASSAEVGSSSSQTGRRTASSRPIESLRRWPADRN